jgi:hypothetical protein
VGNEDIPTLFLRNPSLLVRENIPLGKVISVVGYPKYFDGWKWPITG